MITPIYGQTDLVAQWVASHPPFVTGAGFGNCTAIGWAEDGVLIAGVVYNNYDPRAGIIEISAASKSARWLTRQSLHIMFQYPFEQLGCQMVVMRTSVKNETETGRGINRISKAFGFQQVIVPRLYGRDDDGVLHLLTDDAWRESRIGRRSLQINPVSVNTQ